MEQEGVALRGVSLGRSVCDIVTACGPPGIWGGGDALVVLVM